MAGASNTNNEIVRRNLELDKICRACLEIRRNMRPLFEQLTAAMLMAITKVEVAVGDGLPSQLCLQCVTQISRWHSFKLLVEKNDAILREHVSFLAEEQQEIKEHKPLSHCSVSRDKVTMDHEDTSLENVIKTEEVDLEPDYIECITDVDTDMTDMDEQTENCDTNDNKQTGTVFNFTVDIENVKQSDNKSHHNNGDSQICQDIRILKIKSETNTNDEVSGSELSKLHDSKADTVVHKRDTEHVNNLHISDIYNESRPSTRSLTRHTTEKHASPTKPNTTHKQRAIGTYSCSKCAYRCMKQSTLTRHNIKRHSGKVYSCELCNYKCKQERYLHRHMRAHTDEKPFSCNVCDYKCVRKGLFKQHKRMHTEKLFSCIYCEYKTVYKSHLTVHIRVHTGEKPFTCKLCDFRSAQSCKLFRHMKKHTNKLFTCDVCNSKLLTKRSLKWHMIRTHTGKKPYSCNKCDFKCSLKPNLNRHFKTHTK